MKKTYRIKLQLDGDTKKTVYRTDGVRTFCCCTTPSYFVWEKNTKYNHYQGWNGYITEKTLAESLKIYNPDLLTL